MQKYQSSVNEISKLQKEIIEQKEVWKIYYDINSINNNLLFYHIMQHPRIIIAYMMYSGTSIECHPVTPSPMKLFPFALS